MTDERMGEGLWTALRRLPPGSGVVIRHHHTPAAERRRLVRRVERIGAARRLLVLVAGGGTPGRSGSHAVRGPRPRSWPAHDRREAIAGWRARAEVLFVSPVRPTRSHPGAPAIGVMRAARIVAGLSPRPAVIALGGMDERRWRRIARLGFDGWAGIDAWL
jgi:thiamine-phosphate pyrophosphorylase